MAAPFIVSLVTAVLAVTLIRLVGPPERLATRFDWACATAGGVVGGLALAAATRPGAGGGLVEVVAAGGAIIGALVVTTVNRGAESVPPPSPSDAGPEPAGSVLEAGGR